MKPRLRAPGVPLFVRIAAGYGLILLVMLAIAALTLVRLRDTAAVTDRLSREDVPELQLIDDLRVQILNEQIALTRFEGSVDTVPRGREDLLQPYFRAHDQIFGDLAALAQFEKDPGIAALIPTITRLRTQIQSVEAESSREIATLRSGLPLGAEGDAEIVLVDSARSTAASIADDIGLDIRISAVDAQKSASDSTRLVIMASLIGIGAALAVAIAVTLGISAPLRRLRASADRIAAGEMVEPGLTHRRDEIGSLSRAMTTMVRSLNQQASELKRSNADLEQFAYVASHDLQEPLRMVSGFTGLLKRRYGGKLDADADEYIEFAVSGANRMQSLINDLLSYSRVGREEVAAKAVDTQVALDQALANLQTAIDDRSAMVSCGQLPTVWANHGMLVRLFQNLISNALKFCKAERPIVRIQAEARGGDWVFSVADNGIGIDPQYKDRIFLIFQRLHKQSEYPGTGIGLAVCKRIVERNGGRIWLESEPGKGTTFFFTLPATGGQQIAA
ncbi:MAG TPA: ATP-binding protein [Candidatus Dormibacteraeota bacterium]|nr:ATP-binding protein [Candidatus Dormibacteraeota bacterium]